jgi:hypothetical protein
MRVVGGVMPGDDADGNALVLARFDRLHSAFHYSFLLTVWQMPENKPIIPYSAEKCNGTV